MLYLTLVEIANSKLFRSYSLIRVNKVSKASKHILSTKVLIQNACFTGFFVFAGILQLQIAVGEEHQRRKTAKYICRQTRQNKKEPI